MRYDRKQTNPGSIRRRIILVGFFFSLLYLVIAGKAVYLQVYCSEMLSEKASREYYRTHTTNGKRGTIYDTRMKEMAVTIDAMSVGAHPAMMTDRNRTAGLLAGALGLDPEEVRRRLNSRRPFVWLKRTVSEAEEQAVRQIGLDRKQLSLVSEHRRVYPNQSLAAQVIGFTGVDGHGLEGIEFAFDRYLNGSVINRTVLVDARKRDFDPGTDPVGLHGDGNSLVLSLDKAIQCIAENALAEAVISSEADSGMAVVMNPVTGAILAMANYPYFDPNEFTVYDRALWRNRTVTDAFEPGSTMKVFLAAGAIESGLYKADTPFFCEDGRYRVHGNVINDSRPYGWLTMAEIIKYSSNIGAVKISEQIGKQLQWTILRHFGFGARTGICSPGGTSGLLSFHQQWTDVDSGSIAFGQGISVSAIQLVTAVSAVANGGLMVRPYIVSRIMAPNGDVIMQRERAVVRRVLSENTARVVAEMMKTVTMPGGTGRNAAINGYSVGGKTGTAQKLDDQGRYTDKNYIASFMGFAPADKPEIVALVVVDLPRQGYYGGVVAAPVFRKIVHDTLNYLGVPPDQESDEDSMMVFVRKGGRG